MATQGLTSEQYRQLIMNQPNALERQRLIEMQNQERINMSNQALSPQVNQPGFFDNIFGRPAAIPQTRPEVKRMALNQEIQDYNPAMGNQYPAQGNAFNIFNKDYVNSFNQDNDFQKSLQSAVGENFNLGTGNAGTYTGKGDLPVKPGVFDKMSGSQMMNMIMGLQGLLAQPDSNQRLDTSSPGASSGLRLPTQDLYAGLLK